MGADLFDSAKKGRHAGRIVNRNTAN